MTSPLRGLKLGALKSYIQENFPDLDEQLAGKPVSQALHVLNQYTGLEIQGDESIEESSPKFLTRLREIKDCNEYR